VNQHSNRSDHFIDTSMEKKQQKHVSSIQSQCLSSLDLDAFLCMS